MTKILTEQDNLPSKIVGLMSLYASQLINKNKKTLELCKEEVRFFDKAEGNPGFSHLNSGILFNAFYNLATPELIEQFENKLKELTN